MSKTSCGGGHAGKASKAWDCGKKRVSQPVALAETYAAPPSEILRSLIRGNDVVLAYVVRTCKPKLDGAGASVVLEHTGSGPNMAGGRITLCTCKHLMRTSPVFRGDDLQSNIWIAGFSSSSVDGKNWLYYLMKVDQKFDSQREIYGYLKKAIPDVLKKKLATKNERGDIFEPTNSRSKQFDPDDYKNPHKNHCHIEGDKWKRDIDCQYHGRRPGMLLGDEVNSYCYPNGKIFLNTKPMTQGNRRMRGEDFLGSLNDFPEP
jgi:hypothetical protein